VFERQSRLAAPRALDPWRARRSVRVRKRAGAGAGYDRAVPAAIEDVVRGGALLFDDGRFFEAHEAWEAHWLVEKDETRRLLLQGLIQIAAALHKLVDKRAPAPAASLFAKGLAKLDACPPRALGLDVARFREGVRACARDLERGRFDRAAVPRCL
jgi:predicted metal-dependent hydrolase